MKGLLRFWPVLRLTVNPIETLYYMEVFMWLNAIYRVINKERQCSLGVSDISNMGMCLDRMCSQTEACVLAFTGILAFYEH